MIKQKIFSLLVIITSIFALSHVAFGSTLQTGKIIGDNVNVRTGPGVDADIICRLQQGDSVDVLDDKTDSWLKVQFAHQQTGWVNRQFLQIEPQSEVEQNSGFSPLPIEDILNFAHSLIGVSYAYGGASLRGFDCSGFTMYVLSKFGIHLPHEASRQMMFGSPVSSREDLIPGDLVFFKTLGSKVVNHVGIYLGNNLFIHAASGFGTVRISAMNDSYYFSRYVGGRRLTNNSSGNSVG